MEELNLTLRAIKGNKKDDLTGIHEPLGKIISNEAVDVFYTVVSCWIIVLLSIFGIVTNIINLIVFCRQGFKESVTISLTYIAVWDLLKCVAGCLNGIYKHVGYISPMAGIFWKRVTYPFMHKICTFCGFVSYALATYLSIERCFCVVIPFKVRYIFTRVFTLSILTAISVVTFNIYSVVFALYEIKYYTFIEFQNATVPYMSFTGFAEAHPEIFDYEKIMSIILPTLCFVILCVSSAITLTSLRKSREIHRGASIGSAVGRPNRNQGYRSSLSLKEKQVARTLLVIIAVYIITLFPRVFGVCLPSLIEPDYYTFKLYVNLYNVVSDLVLILDQINASVNMFIFLDMNRNYRKKFFEVFPACRRRRCCLTKCHHEMNARRINVQNTSSNST